MTETPPSSESTAPAPPADETVTIGLGPDLGIYPEGLRPPIQETPPAEGAPEAGPPEPAKTPPAETGPAPPAPKETPPAAQGSSRRANEDAYQRGLAEGRAAIEREQNEQRQRDQIEQTARQTTERIEMLFRELESPDYATQDRARQGILQLYRGNQQAQALQTSTRQQMLLEIAADFGKLHGADGVDDAAYQELHTAPDPPELVRRAIAIGKRSRDDQVARLEAELASVRGRLVGAVATPERQNGLSGNAGGMSWDQYLQLGPSEQRKLPSAQIDEMVSRYIEERARADGRT